MDDTQSLIERIQALEERMTNLLRSSSIPRDVETAFRERLKDIVKEGIIFGTGSLSGGVLDIIDSRIRAESVGIALPLGVSSAFAGRSELAGGFLIGSTCTWRFFEGSFSASYDISYLIIP